MARNEIIKKKLRIAGVSQWALAEKVGVSEQTLYRRLRGEISEDQFEKLSTAIDEIEKGVTDNE